MAYTTVYNNGTTEQIKPGAGWVGGTAPGSTDRAYFGSQSAGRSNFSISTNSTDFVTFDTIYFDSQAAANITFTMPSTSSIRLNSVYQSPAFYSDVNITFNTVDLYIPANVNSYDQQTYYVGAGKTVSISSGNGLVCTVDTNAQIIKTGKGVLDIFKRNYSVSTASAYFFVELRDGTAVLSGLGGSRQFGRRAIQKIGYASDPGAAPILALRDSTSLSIGYQWQVNGPCTVDLGPSTNLNGINHTFTNYVDGTTTSGGFTSQGNKYVVSFIAPGSSATATATISGNLGLYCGVNVGSLVAVNVTSSATTLTDGGAITVQTNGTLTAPNVTSGSPASVTLASGSTTTLAALASLTTGAMTVSGALSAAALATLSTSTLAINTNTSLPALTSLTASSGLSIAAGCTLTAKTSAAVTVNAGTLTGTGTLSFGNGSSLSPDASGFTGTINGDFSVSGGEFTQNGIINGSVTCNGGILTFGGADCNGSIAVLKYVYVYVKKGFLANSGTTQLVTDGGSGVSELTFQGSGRFSSGREISFEPGTAAGRCIVRLEQGASISSPIRFYTSNSAGSSLYSSDTATNTFSGEMGSNQSNGTMNVRCATGGRLNLTGNLYSFNAGRTFTLNGVAGDTGTIAISGNGFGTPNALNNNTTGNAAVAMQNGKLFVNKAGAIGVGAGLTMSSGTTLACASSDKRYSAQIIGNVKLLAGSTMKFGAI